MLPVDRILKQINKVEKYNILDFCTHERYQNTLAKTNHNFFLLNCAVQGNGIKEFWNTKFGTIPRNYTLLPKTNGDLKSILNSLPSHLTFDCIISHQKFGQFQIASQVAATLQIPIISLEHTLPIQSWPPQQLEQCKQMKGNFNVFITPFNQEKWGWTKDNSEVLRHAVDTELFNPEKLERQNTILTVANDYKNRDSVLGFQLWQKATQGLNVRPVGDTPGLSQAPSCVEELVNIYQTSSIFLNTANWSPVPMSLLEAMACGCACVSLNACSCADYIQHGENGLLANDEKEMRLCLQTLLSDEKLRREFGKKARETVEKMCSMERFCKEWNNLFERTFKCS